MDAPLSPRKGHRLWFPTGAVLLAVLAVVLVRAQPELERNFKGFLTSLIFLLALLLVLIWFLFLSRLRWRVRLGTAALLALGVFGLARLLRVDGTTDGTGLPKFVWKWSPSRPEQIASRPQITAGTAAVSVAANPNLADVPQFFGPNRDGTVHGARLARDWNATPPRQLWRQPIGLGWSAFAVAGGRGFTQEQRGESELVSCYDVMNGRLLWAHTNRVRFSQWQGGDGPRATPTVDRGHVFAIGATGILDCLDAANGERLWSRDVLKEHNLPNLIWGVSCSPLVLEDAVVVTGGFTNGPTVFAYHRQTGAPLWQAGMDKASYASPVSALLAGRRVVLSVNAASFTVHDPASGAVLLDYSWANDKWPKAAQPVALDGGRVFLSAGYGVGCVMLQVKAGADGKLAATELWKSRSLKTQFNSAAVRDGFLYGLDDGLLACVDAATGERKWKDGRYGSGQSLLVDDLVLIQSEPGAVILAQAKPDAFLELGRIPALNSKTWNHLTLAGRYLLVRNDQEAACYELPVQANGISAASR